LNISFGSSHRSSRDIWWQRWDDLTLAKGCVLRKIYICIHFV